MNRRSSPNRSPISVAGRDQFSELNEKIVRYENAEFVRGADHATQRLDAAAMAFGARQTARGRPAPVAVHDDSDMQRRHPAGRGHIGCETAAAFDIGRIFLRP